VRDIAFRSQARRSVPGAKPIRENLILDPRTCAGYELRLARSRWLVRGPPAGLRVVLAIAAIDQGLACTPAETQQGIAPPGRRPRCQR
jgi:hypothetical protein